MLEVLYFLSRYRMYLMKTNQLKMATDLEYQVGTLSVKESDGIRILALNTGFQMVLLPVGPRTSY